MTSANKHSAWTEKKHGINKGRVLPKIRQLRFKKKVGGHIQAESTFIFIGKSLHLLIFTEKYFISRGKIQSVRDEFHRK